MLTPVKPRLLVLLLLKRIQSFLGCRIRHKTDKTETTVVKSSRFVPLVLCGFLGEGQVNIKLHRNHPTAIGEDAFDLFNVVGNADSQQRLVKVLARGRGDLSANTPLPAWRGGLAPEQRSSGLGCYARDHREAPIRQSQGVRAGVAWQPAIVQSPAPSR
ncbi:unnamed protein product [Sphagnum balticum]